MKRVQTEFLKGEEILINIIYVITPLEEICQNIWFLFWSTWEGGFGMIGG
jgi:hypothetical protein